MKKTGVKILVLGAYGMLGRAVFLYLSRQFPGPVWGTSRKRGKNSKIFFLEVDSFKKDIKNILLKLKKIDYVINCIAVKENNFDEKEIKAVNTDFPIKFAKIAEEENFKLIHVSTDAVFNPSVGKVNEADNSSPADLYGRSKLLGEPDSFSAISIRTSIIGFDPFKHKGLLEWALNAQKPINGYTNQRWSGCTVLQFAELCEKIILKNSFENMRKKSRIFHFAPIMNTTKYELLEDFLFLIKQKKMVKRSKDLKITRRLKTIFPKELYLNEFNSDAATALKELIEFEKMHGTSL